jgi:hypothetical protein
METSNTGTPTRRGRPAPAAKTPAPGIDFANMPTPPRGGRLFQAGSKPAPGLQPGTFAAYMLPFDDEDTYETVQGQYGESLKIYYGVYLTSNSHAPRFLMVNELAGQTLSVNSKLVKRAAAVTPGIKLTPDTDLGSLNTSGWCMVELIEDPKDDRYVIVNNVTQLPDQLRDRVPEVVTGWDDRNNKPFVRAVGQGDQRTLDGGAIAAPGSGIMDTDWEQEPPF